MNTHLNQDSQVADASCDHQSAACSGRREFLVRATTTAGGLVLGLSALSQLAPAAHAQGAAPAAPAAPAPAAPDADDVVLPLGETSPLSKVGGSQVVDTKAGKVIIVRTGETTFAATSAICTHRGAVVGYDDATKQIVCPRHGARFDLTGAVKKGPATTPLKAFNAGTAAVITIDAA